MYAYLKCQRSVTILRFVPNIELRSFMIIAKQHKKNVIKSRHVEAPIIKVFHFTNTGTV